MSLPSDLQAAISNLQSKHSGLVAAVRGYSGGSVATRTNTKLAEHRAGGKAMDVRTASLRRQIGQFEDTLLLDFVNSMYLSGEGGLDRAYKLQDLVSFSRASIGTYVGSNGLLKTAAANEPRIDYDPVTGECRGLLIEESRANLVLQSSAFIGTPWGRASGISVVAGDVIAPDGSLANKCTLAGTTNHQITQALSAPLTVGATYTISVWIHKSTGAPFGFQLAYYDGSTSLNTATPSSGSLGQWNRISFTFTPSVTAASPSIRLVGFGSGVDGDVFHLCGAQLEAGPFPTSYIPTTDAQVTRAADIASVNTLSPWFSPDEGVIVVEGLAASGTGSSAQHLAVLTDSIPSNNALGLYRSSSGNLGSFIYAGGSAQHDTNDAPAIVNGALVKAALAYKAGDSARCHSGLTPVPVHAGGLPAVTNLRLGSRNDGAGAWNGHIRRLSYTPRRPTNAELQVLTA